MVELILSEGQLARLKAAVTIGSEESAALGLAQGLGNKLLIPSSLPSNAGVRSRPDYLR